MVTCNHVLIVSDNYLQSIDAVLDPFGLFLFNSKSDDCKSCFTKSVTFASSIRTNMCCADESGAI
jgi:hypothetical protein